MKEQKFKKTNVIWVFGDQHRAQAMSGKNSTTD